MRRRGCGAPPPARSPAYNVATGREFDEACNLATKHYTGVVVRNGWAPYRSDTQATH